MATSILHVYPASDPDFRVNVEQSFAATAGAVIEESAMAAAIEALLGRSYPMALVRSRLADVPLTDAPSWDAFRDGTSLDVELLRWARTGRSSAWAQLYDRHHVVAYSMAARVVGRTEAAEEAVISAFRWLMRDDAAGLSVQVRLARAARDAAFSTESSSIATVDPHDPLRPIQRVVIELGQAHRFVGQDIAAVLRLDIRDVRRLATEGLRALGGRHETRR